MTKQEEPDLRILGNNLHQKLIAGDVTAPAEIAEIFLPRLVDKLQQRHPNLPDPHLIHMAADDALLRNYLKTHEIT